ncbi:hypothetical protein KIW84_035411 [Lathyrus oleraceus]|uniref:Uncharacterized protein n=1 Tax=Pisum sativum TaxID=3888 RepID=A0A9D4Y2M6_PEA|nr:hypothetical protein KIW84_035411 [Pisum sativum]
MITLEQSFPTFRPSVRLRSCGMSVRSIAMREKALLMIHLSSFTYVDVKEEVGTPFQALFITGELKKVGAPMSSLKDAARISTRFVQRQCQVMQPVFRNGGFIHENDQHSAAIIKDSDEDEAHANFVTHYQTCNKWISIDVPVVIHHSKLVPKPIECNDPTPSPNFNFPVFEAEEENDDEEVSDELSCLLEHEEKTIHPFEEQIELVNLGSEDDVKEVKIGSQLCPKAKKGFIDLLYNIMMYLLGPIKICLVWILRLWSIDCR